MIGLGLEMHYLADMRIQTLIAFLLFASAAVAGPEPYLLQKEDSKVGFSWFLGKDEVNGTMPVSRADMVLDFDQVANSKVNVAVDVTGAQAGFPFASQGMKSPKVLWADKYPEIIFESTDVRRSGNGALVDGNLTVRGVTRPMVFTAAFFRQNGTEVGDRSRLSIRLTGSLSRSAFGADGWSDLAGDEVKLSILARIRLPG